MWKTLQDPGTVDWTLVRLYVERTACLVVNSYTSANFCQCCVRFLRELGFIGKGFRQRPSVWGVRVGEVDSPIYTKRPLSDELYLLSH